MITYLAVFALGAVLGALAMLSVVLMASPDDEPQTLRKLADDIELRKAIDAAEIRRRYESECI